MSSLIEPGIEPLANALNRLDFVKTIYSCEGHFDRSPNKKFLPTAYVTFSMTDLTEFRKLYGQISAFDDSETSTSLQLSYDCLLGLYTLSIWADVSIIGSSEKRRVVDAAIMRLSDTVLNYTKHSALYVGKEENTEHSRRYPCGESLPPCMLVIPAKELACPFSQPDE